MNNINYFINLNIQLIRSFIIKCNESAYLSRIQQLIDLQTREYLEKIDLKMYYPTDDKKTWKYYLDLAGIYTPSVKPIMIQTLEDNTMIQLTAENLNKYPLTKKDLLKYSVIYQELMNKYPNERRYIMGCLTPVNIDLAINANNGTILNYNKDLIENNEINLIYELNNYSENYFKRWYNKEYTLTDSLYLSTALSILYTSLVLKSINHRISNISTNEVHSFFLEHHFRSNLDIWEEVQILNKSTQMWLYKNLRYLMLNIGKEKTLKLIVNKVFETNNIGVGEYILTQLDPTLIENINDLTKPTTVKEDIILKTKGLNQIYGNDEGQYKKVSEVISEELEDLEIINKDFPDNFKEYYINKIMDISNHNYRYKEKTKLLDISSIKLTKRNGLDIFKIIMDYWVYLLKYNTLYPENIEYEGNVKNIEDGVFSEEIEFVTADSTSYIINAKIGYLMFLKILLKAIGCENVKLTKIYYNSIIDLDKENFQNVIDTKTYKDGYSKPILEAIKNILPLAPKTFNNKSQLELFFKEIIDFSTIVWSIDSNTENFIVSANIKQTMLYSTIDGYYTLSETPKTIDELLKENNINFKIDLNTNLTKTLKRLIKTIIGIELDQDDIIVKNMDKLKSLLNKLTSYTVHPHNTIDVTSSVEIYYNNISTVFMKNGLVMSPKANVYGLEDFTGQLKGKSNPYDMVVRYAELPKIFNSSVAKDKPLYGELLLKQKTDMIAVVDYNNLYPYNLYPITRNYLNTHLVNIDGLEISYSKLDTKGVIDKRTPIKMLSSPLRGYISSEKKIKGELIIHPENWLEKQAVYNLSRYPEGWIKYEIFKFLKAFNIKFEPLEPSVGNVSPLVNNTNTEIVPTPIHTNLETILKPNGEMIIDNNETIVTFDKTLANEPYINSYLNNLNIKIKTLEEPFKLESNNVTTENINIPYNNKVFSFDYILNTTQGLVLPNYNEPVIEMYSTSKYKTFEEAVKLKNFIKIHSITFEPLEKTNNNLITVFSKINEPSIVYNKETLNINYQGTTDGVMSINADNDIIAGISKLPFTINNIKNNHNNVNMYGVKFMSLEDTTGEVSTYMFDNHTIIENNDLLEKPYIEIMNDTILGTSYINENNFSITTSIELKDNIKYIIDLPNTIKMLRYLGYEIVNEVTVNEIPMLNNIETVISNGENNKIIKKLTSEQPYEIIPVQDEYNIYVTTSIENYSNSHYINTNNIQTFDVKDIKYIKINNILYMILGYNYIGLDLSIFYKDGIYTLPNQPTIIKKNSNIYIYYGIETQIINLVIEECDEPSGSNLTLNITLNDVLEDECFLQIINQEYGNIGNIETNDSKYIIDGVDIRTLPGMEDIIID